ncbi:MAG: nuA3 HAT complex component nto1 [Thelocarpon superellum]|nr:MAG: nuA3 HAT complex component nto1 [Thelocarpon superellum]
MAPLPPASRRPVSSLSRNRGRGRPRARPGASSAAHPGGPNGSAPPPMKKRRYIPGGPGGGGRYVDVDGTETPVGGTGPGGYAYAGVRARVGRESRANGSNAAHPPTYSRRRERTAPQPRYSSAAAAAAAVTQGDGYKPREERGWEEFHPDLDIEARFPIYSSHEVDGTALATRTATPPAPHEASTQEETRATPTANGMNGHRTPNGDTSMPSPQPAVTNGTSVEEPAQAESTEILYVEPKRKRAGRPIRRSELLLHEPATPETPKIIPPPGPNPRERLTLPKPSFRRTDPFSFFESKATGQQRYVDRTMANVGYQESDIFLRPVSRLIRVAEGSMEEDLDLGPGFGADGEHNTALGGSGVGRVEYDMDEQDDKWLAVYNALRKTAEVEPITREVFEITMTKIEKEWHALEKRIPKPNPKPPQTHRPRSSSAAAVNGEPSSAAGEEQDSKCAICDDGDCENTNAIVFCDGCDLAVHQECYGVPFIPEGQWLCRKCQLIGRGTPTCIFCPNIDGAFKQTNSSRWSHLLCAIWIPEVSLGNPTFMEPVMDVEKVPRQRWKLTCYICRQRMGACIQCGNKQCFVAFHVTCARRAHLFLKMKSSHGGPATLDAGVLKAYCDKHVPAEWRRDNDVDAATTDAQAFYHHTMRGRLWADSQHSALSYIPSASETAPTTAETPGPSTVARINLAMGSNKRRRPQPAATTWKLPSGAPVIPQVVYNSVESSLQRFMIRKRKEYAAEACKYWTLKREARRGAALLKRLQLQMETFSSMEMTRRNFAGMGAAGRPRLQRRIDFATRMLQDVERVRLLCNKVKKRERVKLENVETERNVIDAVYFPIAPLLWPILERAQSLDGKGVFLAGFRTVRTKLEDRGYTSVAPFSTDLGAVFSAVTGLDLVPKAAADGTVSDAVPNVRELTAEQKDRRRLAKRIVKAIQGMLEEAMRKEADLAGKPFEKELRELDMLLDTSMLSRRGSLTASLDDEGMVDGVTAVEGLSSGSLLGSLLGSDDARKRPGAAPLMVSNPGDALPVENDGVPPDGHGAGGPTAVTAAVGSTQVLVPPTPPLSSEEDLLAPLSMGGIPWYLEPFDPIGTTIHEERWTGREVVRGMSEELSEIDDEELRGMGDIEADLNGDEDTPGPDPHGDSVSASKPTGASARSKKGRANRRWRGYR